MQLVCVSLCVYEYLCYFNCCTLNLWLYLFVLFFSFFLTNRMHTYWLCVYIYVCGRGEGVCVCGGGGCGGLGRCCYVGVYARERDRCMGVRVS